MPTTDPRKTWLLHALARYWPRDADAVERLRVPAAQPPAAEPLPPRLTLVRLPDWALDVGADGGLLVPEFAACGGDGPDAWRQVDWWAAAFWHLNGSAERAFEAARGPVHSYSLRLRGWDGRLWDRAWVNRVALFLRRLAARERGLPEDLLFGPLPAPQLVITHDVDAVAKTLAIRGKQSAFHAINAARALARGRAGRAAGKLWSAARFALSRGRYWNFERIARMEEEAGARSHFNVYAGPAGRRSPKQVLFDPAYDPREPPLRACLRDLQARGWTVGLHQSFGCWADPERMAGERRRLEAALGLPVRSCRQHWLRFAWSRTWRAQQEAGLELDTTLGFNDRPGFRNGAALEWRPWDPAAGAPHALTAMPLVLMDSQLFDYAQLDDEARRAWIARWVGEVRAVRGVATFLWHPHVLSEDYGWARGFTWLLDEIVRPGSVSLAA